MLYETAKYFCLMPVAVAVFVLVLHRAKTGPRFYFFAIRCLTVSLLCAVAIFFENAVTAFISNHNSMFPLGTFFSVGVVATLVAFVLDTLNVFKKITRFISKRNKTHSNLQDAYRNLEMTKPLRELGQSVAFINHEIKNYMMVISGYTALLQRSDTINEKNREMVNNIAEVAAKLQDLSMSVLDLSKSKASHEDTELDLLKIIDSCINRNFYKQTFKFQTHYAVASNSIIVNGSSDKLERVFINAFRNSLEAGANKISIKLSVYNYMALIVIEDDGAGCDAKQLQEFFTTFFTTKQGAGGTGLGLCVIRSIVEVHRGNVSIYSKNLLGDSDHRGLSMQITIPANKKVPSMPTKSEVMLVKDGFKDTGGIMRVLKNIKIIPHLADTVQNIDFKSRSDALGLVVLAATQQAAELMVKAAGKPSIKILAIEKIERKVLIVTDPEKDRRDLFTEEYIIGCLSN